MGTPNTTEVLMDDIEYTSEDIQALCAASDNWENILTDIDEVDEQGNKYPDYSPEYFKLKLKKSPKAYNLIYRTSLENLLLKIGEAAFENYIRWRLSIGK